MLPRLSRGLVTIAQRRYALCVAVRSHGIRGCVATGIAVFATTEISRPPAPAAHAPTWVSPARPTAHTHGYPRQAPVTPTESPINRQRLSCVDTAMPSRFAALVTALSVALVPVAAAKPVPWVGTVTWTHALRIAPSDSP